MRKLVLVLCFMSFVMADSLKEYIEKCNKNNASACDNLGAIYSGIDKTKYGINPDFSKSIKYYAKACGLDYESGCMLLAFQYRNNPSEVGKIAPVEQILKDWCQKQKKCNLLDFLATAYAFGQGKIVKDDIKAEELYNVGCKVGVVESCAYLADGFYEKRGLTQNFAKALKYAELACDLKSGSSCNQAGQMYLNGEGTNKNAQKAMSFLKKGCELDHLKSCSMFAVGKMQGLGVDKDFNFGVELLLDVCHAGEQFACGLLKEIGVL